MVHLELGTLKLTRMDYRSRRKNGVPPGYGKIIIRKLNIGTFIICTCINLKIVLGLHFLAPIT